VRPDIILDAYVELERDAVRIGEEHGLRGADISCERSIDLRFAHQSSGMTLPFPAGSTGRELVSQLHALAADAHRAELRLFPDGPIEVVNVRVRATAPASHLGLRDLTRQTHAQRPAIAARDAYFGPDEGVHRCHVLCRDDVVEVTAGPVIVEDPDTTIVV